MGKSIVDTLPNFLSVINKESIKVDLINKSIKVFVLFKATFSCLFSLKKGLDLKVTYINLLKMTQR